MKAAFAGSLAVRPIEPMRKARGETPLNAIAVTD
jgi:hypothetical protein